MRGRTLLEYERKLVPIYVNESRELFQQRPKRVIQLTEGGWHAARTESRPGFSLKNSENGREFEYTCGSWTVAKHWLGLIRDAIESMELMEDDADETLNCYSNGVMGFTEATRL